MKTPTKVGAGGTAALLQNRLASLHEELARTTAAAAPVELDQTTQGRLSRMDAIQQQAMAASLAERLRTEIRKTDAALDRVADGRYGECCRCGEAIAAERLAADLAAPFCADCVKE
ncbi:MAG: TraR/DksA C4-type zinc finger protein [Gammaproteobacteria bacterium]|nr:TraR/DksA family transcriptional regulator [Rhodocyclaceae bacterium]MBU3909016.1 TraR/DksA C4-type zinc finger protein [Gammaproteobacteria bacterium]MBU3987982.1 TraR/DksA C4-type zinc finger protein [Gammaproteobacteria bacterium]MBU4003773.1 TraR/DksA C4-type zinc finger protein [Gammaproteobacteria bacterium]MBU4021651.1 TraR/DksA C4-type zinc finger protein [Gammaproteobacteria bacterium]